MEKMRVILLQRFTKNTFFVEKNPTIVNFPVKYVVLSYYYSKCWNENKL